MSHTKERPILMSAPNIQSIREDRKTHTRRIVKPQPQVTEQRLRQLGGWVEGMTLNEQVNAAWQSGFVDVKCPYGQPGDRLWAREAWRAPKTYDHLPPRDLPKHTRTWYIADGYGLKMITRGRYRHARFMPRWASRILLEITDVRVERLQDISEADAKAEGVSFGNITDQATGEIDCDAVEAYEALWESVNGAGSWDSNPWVWVIIFKRIEG